MPTDQIKSVYTGIKNIFSESISKAIDCDIATHGAAIAFYMIFSVAPIFILIISVGGIFYSQEYITEQLYEQLQIYIGPQLTEGIQSFLNDRKLITGSVISSIIAIGVIVFGATTVMSQLKTVMNQIWEVKVVHIHSVWQFLMTRLISFGVILLISLLLLTSLLAEYIFSFAVPLIEQLLPGEEIIPLRVFSKISTIVFAVLFFTILFKILPDIHTGWINIIIGAFFTTILFLIGKYLVGYYFAAAGITATYKTAGSLVIFIIWVYYNVQVVLFGAIFTQVYTSATGCKIKPYSFVSLRE